MAKLLETMDTLVTTQLIPAATEGSPVESKSQPSGLGWRALPIAAQLYVAIVILGGSVVLVQWLPRTYPQPLLFALLLSIACLMAVWKVNLPIPLVSGSTLSVSYAAKLMALLLLGPRPAVLIAVASTLTQCTYKAKQNYPLYRTVFSMMAETITMVATAVVYVALGGTVGDFSISIGELAKPLVGAIGTYFVFNTLLIAGAIGLSTRRRVLHVWRDDFLWSGVTFMVAGTAGAIAAIVFNRGDYWIAALLLALRCRWLLRQNLAD